MTSFKRDPGSPHPRQLGAVGVLRLWKSWSCVQPLGHAVSSLGDKGSHIRRHLHFQRCLPVATDCRHLLSTFCVPGMDRPPCFNFGGTGERMVV